ncbi:MAG: hypothetical protein E2O72_01430 [Candidatus Dadabacteria bacterium]|nr:hypothetical protein [Candidatus Dadabacteria bacterium]TDI91676.1 MAG: hypothetical protein E2O72_01430 [Candidatus Dadabacteria bacterium]TDJ00904.1 MAG: hypothetical protein E2O70_04710 [Candidatus Dadabacteria bacterium]
MTKLKRTFIFGLLNTVIASILSLLIVMYMTGYSNEQRYIFWIVWISSLLPMIVLVFVTAFLYHYLCESKKRWVHILWFLINSSLIVGFASVIAFVVLNAMFN